MSTHDSGNQASINISILICTRDRAQSLRETLASLSQVNVPDGWRCELVVVDNGSSDETAQIVREAALPQLAEVRLVEEPRRGVSHARNASIKAARGEVLLCVDDDVRLPSNWIEGMSAPIIEGRAQAVAGGVKIAPHLLRPWMTSHHTTWLASTDRYDAEAPSGLIGANMALAREIFEKIPGYDPELGPGRLGLGEDTLLAEQVKAAGFKIGGALDVAVEHHFDASRLERQSLIERARKGGKGFAYIHYHFHHMTPRLPRLRLLLSVLKLRVWRLLNPRLRRKIEGLTVCEMGLEIDASYWKQYLIEKRRPRNYTSHGLVYRSQKEADPPA